ncbi:hypothetical protein NGB36_09145 [Streptomyces sp. RB6PN25]|uniref:DUF4331 domain-containing protein n=1 Tax=Streptomyces humicola TaxID=2953240 RepID=A0ABT1PSV9_9ACTN|nr:hypothetical protein [Streptomyces humicola]MCQ4080764.1 hypothetical protein [Streptomyces humicola]
MPLEWELRARGSIDDIREWAARGATDEALRAQLPAPYEVRDIAPFSPSGAIYFMNGYSEATVRLRDTGEEITLRFEDENTSIAASAPLRYDESIETEGIYVPVPPPLTSRAMYPRHTPDRYRRPTTLQLLQVVSMNMRSADGNSRLLIGLPYAEAQPDLFFSNRMETGDHDASSYGVVQSLTEFHDPATDEPDLHGNGFPARSFFGIYHLIETPLGAFFNKKATQMELQPSADGKLALTLPPIPFMYTLLNGPIPLFDVNNPDGDPIGDVVSGRHGSHGASAVPSEDAWPWKTPTVSRPPA